MSQLVVRLWSKRFLNGGKVFRIGMIEVNDFNNYRIVG